VAADAVLMEKIIYICANVSSNKTDGSNNSSTSNDSDSLPSTCAKSKRTKI
jgi:hypothetical protein